MIQIAKRSPIAPITATMILLVAAASSAALSDVGRDPGREPVSKVTALDDSGLEVEKEGALYRCRTVKAMYYLGTDEFRAPCTDPRGIVHEHCVAGDLVGTLNGRLTLFDEPDTLVIPDPWSEGKTLNVFHAFDTIVTQHGTITGWERGVTDFDVGFFNTSMIEITGGTGTYDGAFGYISVVSQDPVGEVDLLELGGRICTPKN